MQYGLSDIIEKCHFRVPKHFGINLEILGHFNALTLEFHIPKFEDSTLKYS